jgi:hypothetical protein
MRHIAAEVMEVVGAGSAVAGVFLLLGLGAALVVAGIALVAAAIAVERGA